MESGKRAKPSPLSSLPGDVIVNILKYLPVETLLRCRCVCKDWNSIVTSQSFIDIHLLSQPQGLIFCHLSKLSAPSSSTSERTQLCSFFPDRSFSLAHRFQIPSPNSSPDGPSRIVVGSVDGLLCLTDLKSFGRELHLWNPSIKQWKTLSHARLFDGKNPQNSSCRDTIAFGLASRGHDGDHIIIRIAVFRSRSWKMKNHPPPQAEVYSLRTDSWKEVDFSEDVSKRLMDVRPWHYATLNGDLNWMATFTDGEGRNYQSILSFDVDEEKFKEIRLPSDFKIGIDVIFQRIEEHRGSLAVIIHGKSRPDDGNKYVWLWVMEEHGNVDSWRRTVSSTWSSYLQDCSIFDGEFLCKRRSLRGRRRLELLNMESLEQQLFSLDDFHTALAFKETLVSLRPAILTPAKAPPLVSDSGEIGSSSE